MRVAPDRPDHSENVGIALSQNPVTAATAATVTLYSADGLIAVQEEHDGVVIADVPRIVSNSGSDDDLTSLTWLQNKNLLKSVHELPKHEFINDNASDSALSNSSASSSSSHKSSNQCINVMPRVSYDPQVHVNSKPPFSFSCLIFMAIEDSVEKALPVKDIYVWILNHFPYYRNAPTGWKNSVRHNLSLNKCFKKVDKSPNLGKGSLWMVEQKYRPCLIQALQKTPHHQYHKFIRNLNNNNDIDDNSNTKATHENNSIICDTEDSKPCTNNEIIFPAADLPPSDGCGVSQQTHSSSIYTKENLSDDVDAAATAMLVLKHGAYAFDIKSENVDFVLNDKNSSIQKPVSEDKSESVNGAIDDHNYGCHHYTPDKLNSSSDSGISVDKEPMDSYWITDKEDIEEQRKIVEGADALLNLAGITTYNTRKRTLLVDEQRNIKQLCLEQIPPYRPRLLRKEKFSDPHSPDSISSSETNQFFVDNDKQCDAGSRTSYNTSFVEDQKKTQRSRSTSINNNNNRRLRKKIRK